MVGRMHSVLADDRMGCLEEGYLDEDYLEEGYLEVGWSLVLHRLYELLHYEEEEEGWCMGFGAVVHKD